MGRKKKVKKRWGLVRREVCKFCINYDYDRNRKKYKRSVCSLDGVLIPDPSNSRCPAFQMRRVREVRYVHEYWDIVPINTTKKVSNKKTNVTYERLRAESSENWSRFSFYSLTMIPINVNIEYVKLKEWK